MKVPITLLLLMASLAMFTQAEVKQAKSIIPSEMGVRKWTLSGSAEKDEVLVFRREIVRIKGDEKDVTTFDEVHYNPGKEVEGAVYVIDSNHFNPQADGNSKWHINTFGNSTWIEGSFDGSTWSGNSGHIVFKGKDGYTYNVTFKTFTSSLSRARKVYNSTFQYDLKSWSWHGSPKK